MLVLLHLQEFGGVVEHAERQPAVPGPDRDVGDGVIGAAEEAAFGEAAVEHVELALGLHREAVDGVFDLRRGIGVEMAEAAAEIGRAAHLPEQPGEALGARRRLGRQEGAELFGEMDEDGAGLEHPDRLFAAAVEQRRDLRIRIDRDEAAGELVAVADPDRPGVVFGARMTRREQFLEHNRDLHAIGRGERIELQRMAPDRELLVMRRTGDRPVDVGEASAIGLVPGPDLRRRVFTRLCHVAFPKRRRPRPRPFRRVRCSATSQGAGTLRVWGRPRARRAFSQAGGAPKLAARSPVG